MSKQYLQTHTIVDAHPADIFAIAVTPQQILSASGSSAIHIHNLTFSPDEANPYPHSQTLQGAHKLGVHHLCTSGNGKVAASAGFGGDLQVWECDETSAWQLRGGITDNSKAGELWAIALSEDGQYLAGTTHDGKVNVWNTKTIGGGNTDGTKMIRQYETKGSFGMSVDLSSNGEFTASGHANGSIHLFNNTSGRLAHSLQGLVKAVRAVSFSPACKLLAAGGDARIIALYDVQTGEQVANFSGSGGWIMSLDWNWSGEYLLSGGYDGKAKVWSIDRRECVATQTESDKSIWSVKWVPRNPSLRNETFVSAGANRSISFYREASGT